MTDQELDARLEKLLLGKHGWWTLRAVEAMCFMRDQCDPLSKAAWQTSGKDEACAIMGHYSLVEGVLMRELEKLHPDMDRLLLRFVVGGPADFDPERRKAIYGEMFERAERAHRMPSADTQKGAPPAEASGAPERLAM